jgi:hypothetical protein
LRFKVFAEDCHAPAFQSRVAAYFNLLANRGLQFFRIGNLEKQTFTRDSILDVGSRLELGAAVVTKQLVDAIQSKVVVRAVLNMQQIRRLPRTIWRYVRFIAHTEQASGTIVFGFLRDKGRTCQQSAKGSGAELAKHDAGQFTLRLRVSQSSIEAQQTDDTLGVRVRVPPIEMGFPVGADLEYADEVTMLKAMEGRRDL